MSARTYTLRRVAANGHEAPLVDRVTLAKARQYVGLSLYDNGAAGKAEAQTFARTVTPGEWAEHVCGRRYLIEPTT